MKENSIEKTLENIQNVDLITLLRKFKKEGVENFIVIRRNNFDEILSDYKRVLKENEKLKDKLLDTLEGQKVIKEETPQYIKENYIPVEKVKEKIEELKQEKKKYGNCLIEMYEDELVNRDIKILQELLESEE